jgi:alpha-N-arabinofuranosidase
VIRWPGGCFADTYHWRDGLGPRESRPKTANSRWGWDEVEPNAVGTHEFLDLCERTGATPWLNGNVATADAREMTDWVEYTCFEGSTRLTDERRKNGREERWSVPYWGIGNECWDCGGKFTPTEYAEAYRRFESSLPRFQAQPLSLIACGPDGNKPHESSVWTREVLQRLFEWRRPRVFGLDAHFYVWGDESGTGFSDRFSESQYRAMLWRALQIETLIDEQRAILDEFDPNLALVIGEWGAWHPDAWKNRFWQHVTLRDAAIAMATLDVFHRHCGSVQLATKTMLCNVLSAPFQLRDGVMVRTPTYWAMWMAKAHRGGVVPETEVLAEPVEFPWGEDTLRYNRLSVTVSRKGGRLFVSVANLNPRASEAVQLRVQGAHFSTGEGWLLAHEDLQASNTPSKQEHVRPQRFSVSERDSDRARFSVPAGGIVCFPAELA